MRIMSGDCFNLIKDLDDNSVDLVITSPPYSDIVSYGKSVDIKKPSDYCDWILPLFIEINRVLKPSGSFILNINDKCVNGFRSTFIYDLISRSQRETPLKLYDTYFWHKVNGIPNGSEKRFRNTTEFIFHFTKSRDIKFFMDRVLQDVKDETIGRYNRQMTNFQGEMVDGKRIRKVRYKKNFTDGVRDHEYAMRELPNKVRPDNVFRFKTASAARDNSIKHPAPFHKELPSYFINLLTDVGDMVLDPFSGIGTTGIACKELDRNYIGFELNDMYVDFSIQRIKNHYE